MERDKWDKLSLIGTFISSTVVVIFTSVTAWYGGQITRQLENYKAVQQEGIAVSSLIKELTKDTTSTIKYDYAFLSLERYLKNTNEGVTLKPQDKEMLVGFAQSLILDRYSSNKPISEKDQARILIPSQFLEKNDPATLQNIKYILESKSKSPNYPVDKIADEKTLQSNAPVSQTTNINKTNSIGLIIKKIAYIQYTNPKNVNYIKTLQNNLKSKQWIAPKLELVNGSYSNIIKYFHPEDLDLAEEAKQVLGNNFKIVSNLQYQDKVAKGQIEIWVNND